MNFNFYMPTALVSGVECIKNNKEKLAVGKRCFIVTGKHGAKMSGALDDVISVLDEKEIPYKVFDEIKENPAIATCFKGGKLCAEFGADFVVGIGGGSAIDAAKAISAYASNKPENAEDIYDKSKITKELLPIIAIPTTSGTGSEANPYSIMTLADGTHKKNFSAATSWPKYGFLDPRYTESLGYDYTVSTALDAFAHSLESYLSPKATEMSGLAALYAAKNIWNILKQKGKTAFDRSDREALMYAAAAAGIAISMTGTGFPHPLGYSLTLLDGIPHGKACAVFEKSYIEYNMKSEIGKEKIEYFCRSLEISSDEMGARLYELADVKIKLSEEKVKEHVDLVKNARNYFNSPYAINEKEMLDIYKKLFL